MTLTEIIQTALAQQVQSRYTFTFDAAKDTWTVAGTVAIAIPEDKLDLNHSFTWEVPNRHLTTSHHPKLKLEALMAEWGLKEHPRATDIFLLLDMQFRNERNKIIDQVFEVYRPGEPTNF